MWLFPNLADEDHGAYALEIDSVGLLSVEHSGWLLTWGDGGKRVKAGVRRDSFPGSDPLLKYSTL